MIKWFLAASLFARGPDCEAKEPIRAVVFDFGKVVIHTNYNQICQFLKERIGVSDEEALDLIEQRKSFLIAGGSEEEFFGGVYSEKGEPMPENFVKDFYQAWEDAIHVNRQVQRIIESLKRQNTTLILFSNTEKYRADLYRRLGYYDPFEMHFLSYEMGIKKPDDAAFIFVTSNSGFKPEECLFIDDKQTNIRTARRNSWHAIHYKNADQLEADLNKIGFKIDTNLPT